MVLTGQEVYTAICILMAALFHAIKAPEPETTDSSTSLLLLLLCSTGKCRNGECYTVNREAKCICDSIFSGDRCEKVNLAATDYAIVGTVVVFKWARPPRLKGYAFVYYEPENPNAIMFKRTIYMKENENSILVGNLKGGKTLYRICIEDEELAEKALLLRSKDLLSNCLELVTEPDWHTLAGWCLAVILSFVAVLLMYSQRRKIELLYFGSKPYLQRERKPVEEEVVSNAALTTSGSNGVSMVPR